MRARSKARDVGVRRRRAPRYPTTQPSHEEHSAPRCGMRVSRGDQAEYFTNSIIRLSRAHRQVTGGGCMLRLLALLLRRFSKDKWIQQNETREWMQDAMDHSGA